MVYSNSQQKLSLAINKTTRLSKFSSNSNEKYKQSKKLGFSNIKKETGSSYLDNKKSRNNDMISSKNIDSKDFDISLISINNINQERILEDLKIENINLRQQIFNLKD